MSVLHTSPNESDAFTQPTPDYGHSMRQTRLCPKKLCTSSAVFVFLRRDQSVGDKRATLRKHRQSQHSTDNPGIVRRLARRRTIQVVGALFVSAHNLVCLKSMRVACGFVFLDNQTRVALEALRILGVGTRSSRFSHSTFEHGGPENCCRSKPKLGSGYALYSGRRYSPATECG